MSPQSWAETALSLIPGVGCCFGPPGRALQDGVTGGRSSRVPHEAPTSGAGPGARWKCHAGGRAPEWWPRQPKRCRERGKLPTKKLQSWTRICRKRQRHLKGGWVRCNFNRRNNRGQNKGGKGLSRKRKSYTCMWGDRATKKVVSEWKGSSLEKANVMGKQRRELTRQNEKGRGKGGQFTKPLGSVQMRGELVLLRAQGLHFDRTRDPTQFLTCYSPSHQKWGEVQGYGNYTNILFFKVWPNVFSKPVTWICEEADFMQKGITG